MIYEFRTYARKPRSLAEVEKRFGEAYEYRKKYSPLTAFWHTEIGPLNESIHAGGHSDPPGGARRARADPRARPPGPAHRDGSVEPSHPRVGLPRPGRARPRPGRGGQGVELAAQDPRLRRGTAGGGGAARFVR